MKYAVLGGSFDPVHNGHLAIANAALKAGYDRIILVPAFQSPFKSAGGSESGDNRLALLLAAIEGNRRLTVDMCELRREGVSYTIDTITDIYERYTPDGKLGLIIGDDLAADFSKWNSAEEIVSRADICIAKRLCDMAPPFPFPHTTIPNKIIPISSAELRKLLREGGQWQQHIPPAARDTIIERGLYGAKASGGQGPFLDSRFSRKCASPALRRDGEFILRAIAARHGCRWTKARPQALGSICNDIARQIDKLKNWQGWATWMSLGKSKARSDLGAKSDGTLSLFAKLKNWHGGQFLSSARDRSGMWTAANADGHIGADSPVFAGTPAKMRPNSAAETRALAIERAARAALDTQRFVHSRMVALHAADLCERYGLDPEKGWIAGLGHDLCKGLTSEEYLRLAALDGLPVSDFERAKPGMLHGRAAAVLLAAVFGIEDGDILEAVRLHTGGGRGMGALAKIVYLADKIEAGRYTVEKKLRERAFGPPPNPPLDELFTTVVQATAAWLTERGLALAPETLELLEDNV